jgi:uroporphyrinogen-III synthase
MKELLARCAVACIGPITRRTAEEAGMRVDIVAKEYTVAGLTKAMVEYFKDKRD